MKGGAFLKGKEGRVGFRTPSFKIDEDISKNPPYAESNK